MSLRSPSILIALFSVALLFNTNARLCQSVAGSYVLEACYPGQEDVDDSAQSETTSVLSASNSDQPQLLEFSAQSVTSASIPMVGPFPSILKVWMTNDEPQVPLEWTFNQDASTATVHLRRATKAKALSLSFLVAKHSGGLNDGTFVFSAADATVVGKQAKLESHPGNYRIGYWGNANDFVKWNQDVPKGKYDVELVYSRASRDGTKVTLSLGETAFSMALKSTTSWYRYRTVSVGSWEHFGGKIETTMKVDEIINGGVMNLKAVILTPQSESIELTDQWQPLLDKSLDGWEVFTGVPHKTTVVPNFPQSDSEDCRSGTPVGNSDPLNIFSIGEMDGEPVLNITGQGYAGVSSLQQFGDYQLSLEYKWGEKKYEPRINAKRDSGVLVHCSGEHGAFWKAWLRSLECQVQETDTGDFIALAGVSATAHVSNAEKIKPVYQAQGTSIPVGAGTKAWGMERRANFERENDWNRVDVFAIKDQVVFAVNGNVVMRLNDCKIGKQADGMPLTKGRIQIQSESAEITYRRIRIRSIQTVPSEDTLVDKRMN